MKSSKATNPNNAKDHMLLDDLLASPPNSELNEYYKIELDQVVNRIASLENYRVQLASLCGTANITAIGIAMTVQKAGIVFIATLILVLFAIVDSRFRALNVAYYYRGVQLQRKFAPGDDETFLQIAPGEVGKEARKIAAISDTTLRHKRLSQLMTSYRSSFLWLTVAVICGEVVTGIILWRTFNWPMF